MVIGNPMTKTFDKTHREELRKHFKQRESNPPYDALPWTSAWIEYVEEMRELERQLTEAGERVISYKYTNK